MKDLKINYIDWWDNGRDFVFTKILSEKYNIIFEEPDKCDFIFVGPFGDIKNRINTKKIYYTGENTRNPNLPNLFCMNYNIDSDYVLPIYHVTGLEYTELNNKNSPLLMENRIINDNRKFCGFLVSNPMNEIRNNAFSEISKYKSVDSGGRVLNNVGYHVDSTIEWMSGYKFFISFENSKYDGYITEKLINAYHAGCLPIYWGSDEVGDINENCFINANSFNSFGELVEYIEYLDKNDYEFNKKLNQTFLKSNQISDEFDKENIIKRIIEYANI